MLLPLAILTLLVHKVISLQCGVTKYTSTENPISQRIIGGSDAKEGAWPWLVALATREKIQNLGGRHHPVFKCSGSLISNRHVITAAHCYDEKLYLVRLGTTYLYSINLPFMDILIDYVVVHEKFDVLRAHNDIALIILKRKVIFSDLIRPICLPWSKFFSNNTYENMTSIAVGWGDVTFGSGSGYSLLQEVTLPVFNFEECQDIYQRFEMNITEQNICVGLEKGGKDACQGDSGGPLMTKDPTGQAYFLIGIISHGLGCGLQGIPGVYTKVASYIPWIYNILRHSKNQNFKYRSGFHPKTPTTKSTRFSSTKKRNAVKKFFRSLTRKKFNGQKQKLRNSPWFFRLLNRKIF